MALARNRDSSRGRAPDRLSRSQSRALGTSLTARGAGDLSPAAPRKRFAANRPSSHGANYVRYSEHVKESLRSVSWPGSSAASPTHKARPRPGASSGSGDRPVLNVGWRRERLDSHLEMSRRAQSGNRVQVPLKSLLTDVHYIGRLFVMVSNDTECPVAAPDSFRQARRGGALVRPVGGKLAVRARLQPREPLRLLCLRAAREGGDSLAPAPSTRSCGGRSRGSSRD